jgi:hypothetical protein
MPCGTSEYTLTQEATKIIENLCIDGKTKTINTKKFTGLLKIALSVAFGAIGAIILLKFR